MLTYLVGGFKKIQKCVNVIYEWSLKDKGTAEGLKDCQVVIKEKEILKNCLISLFCNNLASSQPFHHQPVYLNNKFYAFSYIS